MFPGLIKTNADIWYVYQFLYDCLPKIEELQIRHGFSYDIGVESELVTYKLTRVVIYHVLNA